MRLRLRLGIRSEDGSLENIKLLQTKGFFKITIYNLTQEVTWSMLEHQQGKGTLELVGPKKWIFTCLNKIPSFLGNYRMQ